MFPRSVFWLPFSSPFDCMSIVHVCWPPSVQSSNQTTTSARSTATAAAVQLIASRSPSSHPHLDCQSFVHSELDGSWLSMVARVFCQYSSRPPIDTTPRGLWAAQKMDVDTQIQRRLHHQQPTRPHLIIARNPRVEDGWC